MEATFKQSNIVNYFYRMHKRGYYRIQKYLLLRYWFGVSKENICMTASRISVELLENICGATTIIYEGTPREHMGDTTRIYARTTSTYDGATAIIYEGHHKILCEAAFV